MSVERCYIIYDCPRLENDKQWLTCGLRQNGIEITNIMAQKVQSHLINKNIGGKVSAIIDIITQCLCTIRQSGKNDVIICWSSLCGVIFNEISTLMGNRRTIISMNWLAPPDKKSRLHSLQRKLFINQNVYIAVNSKLAVKKWCTYFEISNCSENKFLFLPDVYDNNEPFIKPRDNRKQSSIFSGGMNNRDWKKIVELAYEFPKIKFVCVASKQDWMRKVQESPSNIEVYFQLPVKEYYRLMKEAGLILLPLLEDRPSGLINILKSAQFGIICCTNNYETNARYYEESVRDLLLDSSIEQWKNKIRELWDMDETEYLRKAYSFQNYIKKEFSPDNIIRQLVELLRQI